MNCNESSIKSELMRQVISGIPVVGIFFLKKYMFQLYTLTANKNRTTFKLLHNVNDKDTQRRPLF